MRTRAGAGEAEMPQQSLLRRAFENAQMGLGALIRPPRHVRPSRLRAMGLRLVLGALLALAAIAATMLLLDGHATAATRHLPQAVLTLFNEVTEFGRSAWLLIPLAILLGMVALVSSPALGRMGQMVLASLAVRLGYVFLAVGIPGLLVTIGKRLIGRVRPSELGQFAYVPGSWEAKFASLPSGHATTAFATAVAVSLVWPRARVPVWIFAIVIGLSRVVVSAHYPSDVLAGALVGGFAAILVRDWFAARHLGFAVGPEGRVIALPGPSLRRVKSVAGRLFGQ